MTKTLIAYFSRAGENYFSGGIKEVEIGNTEILIKKIAEKIDVDTFKIEMKNPYSSNYQKCIDEAKIHQKNGERLEIISPLNSIDNYDKIILAYPNYWGTIPMAVYTFLELYDFSGKEILPICTHEGSGLGSSVRDISKVCTNSSIRDGLAIKGSSVKNADSDVENWIKKNNL